MSRLKNYGLWLAIAALVGLFVNDLGLLAPDKYDQYVNAILTVLIAAGIVNNPSSGKGFKDKEDK
jgi:uncharacterized membrane protein